jgi:hypothetical protein
MITNKENGLSWFRRMRSSWFAWFAMLGLVLLLTLTPAPTQVATGTLSGTVTDTSGAVIPDAEILLINQATNVSRQTLSNGVGYFSFVAIQPGVYTVTIKVTGFQPWTEKDLAFSQAENRTFSSIALNPGSAVESVEVSANVTAVPLDTPESRMTLNTQMITDMAIQGRNAGELIKIMPGMAFNRGLSNSAWNALTTQTNSGPIGQYSASGTQPYGSVSMTSDGASIVDIGNMGTQVANINQDQTAEVTILNSTFGAEFAKGPVTFQAISKGGTKDFHGSGYLYARNGVFNAYEWYSKYTDLRSGKPNKPDDSYYYPGFTLGGPVTIPGTNFNRNRDKLFFFTGYEYMKQSPVGVLFQSIVPTPAMLSGDFSSAQVGSFAGDTNHVPCDASLSGNWWYGAYCGSGGAAAMAGGIIPASMFDPNAIALAKLFPKPNQDPLAHNGYNYSILDSTPVNRWEYKLKMDYVVSPSTHLAGSYTRQSEGNTNRFGVWWWPGGTVPYPSTLTATTLSRIINLNLTHAFSPSMTNDLVFAYSYFTFPPFFSNAKATDPANLAGYTDARIWSSSAAGILPQIPNLVSWSCNQSGGGGGGGQGCFPHIYGPGMTKAFNNGFGNRKSVPSIADNLAKVVGTHTLKTGFYFDLAGQAQTSSYGSWGQGMYIFDNWTGNSTGNYLADFLIGHGQYTQTQKVPVIDIRYKTLAFYGQDQWKVTPKLTLTYGLRFDHIGQWYPIGDHPGFAIWDGSLYDDSSTAGPYSGMTWHARNSSIPISGWESKWSYSPRVGAAFDLFGNGRTVLRGGFGVYPWQVTTNDVGGTYLVPLGFRTVTTGALTHLADVNSYTPGSLGSFNGDSSFALKKGDNKIPFTQNWNFIVSQQLPWKSILEIQYAGNRTRDALLTGNGSNARFISNLNKIPLGALWGPDPITGVPCPPNAAAGLTCDPTKWSDTQIQHFRPYQNYGKALIEVTHGSYANYNALMMTWHKTAGPITFNTNYTFSKVLGLRDGQTNNGNGDGPTMNPFNARANYGVMAFDHTHIFNAAYTVKLPSLEHESALLRGIANGWEIVGLTQWQSGPPLQPNTIGNLHASLPVSERTILGTDGGGQSMIMPYLTCDPRRGLGSGQYFNPNCFGVPNQIGVNGTYVWPYIKGPAYATSDLSLYKTFKLTERHNVQFRASAFNFLNHPLSQFEQGAEDTTMRFQTVAGQPANTPLDQLQFQQTNTYFTGKPVTKTGRRVFEFALKYTF